MDKTHFLNKVCRVTYLSGFILNGVVTDIDDAGIMFQTPQETSFICWNAIRDLRVLEHD